MPPGDRPLDITQISLTPTPFVVNDLVSINPSPANDRRTYLLIQNNSVNEMGVAFGKSAGTLNDYVIAGQSEKEWVDKVPIDSVNLICRVAASTATGVILEGRWPNTTSRTSS